MMRSDGSTVLLAVVGLLLTACLLCPAAGSAKAPPRLSEEQARQKAAAMAKALGVPWDESATATLSPANAAPKGLPPDPALWEVRCRDVVLRLRGDTGAVVSFDRPPSTAPNSGREPPTEEQAVAVAERALHALGAAPDAPPTGANLAGGNWHFAWERRTPDGILYSGDTTRAIVDVAGRVASAAVLWRSRPPEDTEAKVSKEQAVKLALDAYRQSGRVGADGRRATARLAIVRSGEFGRSFTKQYDVPTRLAWVVVITRPAARVRNVATIDAANGKVLATYSMPLVMPPEQGARGPRPRLALWVGAGALVAAFAAAAAYLARRRGEKPGEDQEG